MANPSVCFTGFLASFLFSPMFSSSALSGGSARVPCCVLRLAAELCRGVLHSCPVVMLFRLAAELCRGALPGYVCSTAACCTCIELSSARQAALDSLRQNPSAALLLAGFLSACLHGSYPLLSWDCTYSGGGQTYCTVVHKRSSPFHLADNPIFPQMYHDSFAGHEDGNLIKKVGKKAGKPAIFFSDAEISSLAEKYKFTLVGEVQLGRPKMEIIRKVFEDFKLVRAWQVGLFDRRHVMIQLSIEEHYTGIFSKKIIIIEGKHMKVLKWTPDFDPSQEPSIASIWFSLPELKLQLFDQPILYATGTILEKPLQVDIPTVHFSRPSTAKILIERDITLPDVEAVWLGSAHNDYWQQIIMKQKPYYCTTARCLGTRRRNDLDYTHN